MASNLVNVFEEALPHFQEVKEIFDKYEVSPYIHISNSSIQIFEKNEAGVETVQYWLKDGSVERTLSKFDGDKCVSITETEI